MTFSCFVLSKGSSSYAYIEAHQIEGGATAGAIIHATRKLVSRYYKWESTDAIGIELYQVLLNPTLHRQF